MNSIFVIADVTQEDDGRHMVDVETIDPDYGYYLTREDAEEAVAKMDAPALARYEEAQAKYKRLREKYDAEAQRAYSLGFQPRSFPPSRPSKPWTHTVIEIEPAKEGS